MDVIEARQATRSLLDELTQHVDPDTIRFVAGDLDAGEQGLALDLLVAVVTQRKIPVTPAQRDLIREIIVFFDLNDSGRRAHPALADPDRAIAGLTVVERP